MPPVGLGAGLGGAAFFAAAFLAGAFFAGAFLAAAFFAGAFAEAAAFFAGGFLAAEEREAMDVRLPVEKTVDTCAHCFTRSCRPRRCGELTPVHGPVTHRTIRRLGK